MELCDLRLCCLQVTPQIDVKAYSSRSMLSLLARTWCDCLPHLLLLAQGPPLHRNACLCYTAIQDYNVQCRLLASVWWLAAEGYWPMARGSRPDGMQDPSYALFTSSAAATLLKYSPTLLHAYNESHFITRMVQRPSRSVIRILPRSKTASSNSSLISSLLLKSDCPKVRSAMPLGCRMYWTCLRNFRRSLLSRSALPPVVKSKTTCVKTSPSRLVVASALPLNCSQMTACQSRSPAALERMGESEASSTSTTVTAGI
ncbi:hypothetical protein K431DRAFT_68382 [Polychaeton citri CBS 116435]|uniref:Uncharacterized protein n=1 Tax=Polychaeton citri CBS 116435 TaxID=1314669 RepID=A0A9P4QB25_9PEZI|nr:hypothetical protein K431DRAFT_68382 [Polychaeton citri CBS 116435]